MMTNAQIEKKAAAAQVPFQLAVKVRRLLDEAKKAGGYTAEEWSEIEQQVIELVTGE